MSTPLYSVLVCALLPACSELAQVDVAVDEVCLTYPGLKVPARVAGLTPTQTLAQSFTFDDLAPLHQLLAYDADLQFVRAQVRTTDADALAGIERASVGVASNDANQTLPRIVAYACDGDCVEPDASLQLPAERVSDALGYVSAKTLAVDLSASGALPSRAWTMDVDVCMSGRASYVVKP